MKRNDQHSNHHGENEGIKPEKLSRNENGSACTSTPETRAKEGVHASFREDPQIADEGDTAHSEDAPSSSSASASVPASQPYDTYDPYLYARHDIYQHHQYDDYYLMDDYYYHDDYYPHLYYDTPSSSDYHPAPLPLYEPPYEYGPLTYHDYERSQQESRQPAEGFVTPAAAMVGAAWAGDYVQEITPEVADDGSYAAAQALDSQDLIHENQGYVHQATQTSLPSEFVQPHQAAQIQESSASFSEHSVIEPSLASAQLEPLAQTLVQPSQDLVQPSQGLTGESQVEQVLQRPARSDFHEQAQAHALENLGGQEPIAQTKEASFIDIVNDGHAASVLNPASSVDETLQAGAVSQSNTPFLSSSSEPALFSPYHSVVEPSSAVAQLEPLVQTLVQPSQDLVQPSQDLVQPSQGLMGESQVEQVLQRPARSDFHEQAQTKETSVDDIVSFGQAASVLSSASSVDETLQAGVISQEHPSSYLSSEGFEHPLSCSQVLPSNSEAVDQIRMASSEPASLLNAEQTENLLDNSVLHQLQNQPLATSHIDHVATPTSNSESNVLLEADSRSSVLSYDEPVTNRLTVNRLSVNQGHDLHDGLQSIHPNGMAAQPENAGSVLTEGFVESSVRSSRDSKLESVIVGVPASAVLQQGSDRPHSVKNHAADALLPEQDAKVSRSGEPTGELLSAPEKDASLIDSETSLLDEPNVVAAVLNRSEAKDTQHHGSDSRRRLRKAEAAALGTLKFSGKVAQVGAAKAVGALDYAANQLLREDDDLTRVADLDDVVRDGIVTMNRHMPVSDSDSIIDRLLSSERSIEETVKGNGESHAEAQVKETGRSRMEKGKSGDASLKAKQIGVREKPEAVNASELFAVSQSGNVVSSKAGMLETGPAGLQRVAVEAANHEGAERHLIDKDKDAPDKKKKPVTERERDLEKKKAERKAAKKEKNDSKALSVVKAGGNLAAKGALLAGGMAASSTKKALASRNEEIAVAMSTVDKTKKTVKSAKTLVRMPFTIYRYARRAVQAVVNTVKHLFNFAAALTSMGPAGAVIALALFFLVIVVIVILFATASIINDEQEVSEVSALVAELDAELTEDIQSLGDQPILYLDANDTYGQKGDNKKDLTKDADFADQEADYQEVVASSVTVQTDPGEVVAYIDAKYTGNWQVGAASWKYTIDAFGETWNIIEWDDMPEWVWKALNKVNRVDFKITLRNELTDLIMEEFGVEEFLAREIGSDTAEEFATVIYDNQIQGVNEDILMQIIKDNVKKHKKDLDLTSDQTRKLYYQMMEVVSDLIGEEDPFAFVYDEIILLHERMNYWSEEYDSFETSSIGSILSPGTGSGSNNKYGYPNSSGYNPTILSSWDGYNEVSVYGVSEAGTTSVTADGTRITNTWDDTNMGIACEGLQNYVFAYWSADYKNATGITDGEPVKITLMNPETGKSVTAEVIDCGGWRGFNPNYAGMNADRQWDLLPAVWKGLGGSESAGTMKVYWKVDPDAVVGSAAAEPKVIEDYPWPKETDEGDGTITITRPALVTHGIQDALNNNPLMEEIIDKDSFATEAEFKIVRNFVVTKVKDVMKTLLTMENSEGESYVDYNYIRRNLGDPFGDDKDGDPNEWVVTHRFNPGYEDFDEEEAYVEIKPLSNTKKVKAILEGEVEEVDDGEVIIRSYIDTANSSEVVYSNLTDIKVEEGDEIKQGQTIGKMADDVLRISYYEINDAALQIETKKDWAYDPGLYMIGFAGYEEPSEPEEYVGTSSDYSGCQTVVEFAYSRLGCPYVWGATGPNTFDCSGLTQWCYAQAGISIPRNSEAQHDAAAAAGNIISLSDLKPGDILWKSGHVGIYIGNNQYIHAPRTGDVVKISTGVDYFSCGLRFG